RRARARPIGSSAVPRAVSIGRYSSRAPPRAWTTAPPFKSSAGMMAKSFMVPLTQILTTPSCPALSRASPSFFKRVDGRDKPGHDVGRWEKRDKGTRMTRVIGWDLGGANIKLASIEDGRIASVVQIPCPIIPERRKFDAAVEAALPLIAPPASHAVTMTGELSDVFGDRAQGVAYLVDLMVRTAGAQPLSIYAGGAGFLAPHDAKRLMLDVASANWHATASLVARHHADGLLVDVGTTTTDLIPIKAGKVAARAATDAERL